jgi:flagellar basal body-associated protein FliL
MAAKTLTLNQIVSQVKAIAEAHQQIKNVYFGDFD